MVTEAIVFLYSNFNKNIKKILLHYWLYSLQNHQNSYLMRYHRDTVVDFAGLVLWCHVAVSYAINSPALCTAMDDWRLSAHTSTATTSIATTPQHILRLTGSRPSVVLDHLFFVTGSSYLVANAISILIDRCVNIGTIVLYVTDTFVS